MKVVGITAEYNPLHFGHAHHIAQSRRAAGADAVLVALSSNFVQRGEPAMLDKGARAEMALAAGADLVIELPVVWSCASAGTFASGAADLLASTGVVDAISFGMEDPDADLTALARADLREDDAFKEAMRASLDRGMSYAAARAEALEASIPGAAAFLRRPNDLLALEYAKRIAYRDYNIEMIKIERSSSSYRDDSADDGPTSASATAVRAMLARGEAERAARYMPRDCADIMRREMDAGRAVITSELYWRIARAVLVRMSEGELSKICDVREGIESRILRLSARCDSYEAMLDECETRRYTRGRVSRLIASALLGLSDDAARMMRSAPPPYIRPLAMNGTGRDLLRAIKERASVPIAPKASAPFGERATMTNDIEHRATAMRELSAPAPDTRREAKRRPLIG